MLNIGLYVTQLVSIVHYWKLSAFQSSRSFFLVLMIMKNTVINIKMFAKPWINNVGSV